MEDKNEREIYSDCEITAKNMKIIAERYSDDIDKWLKRIKECALKGETEIYFQSSMKETTYKELKMRGFKFKANRHEKVIQWD